MPTLAPKSFQSQTAAPVSAPAPSPETKASGKSSGRLETWAYYIFLVMLLLAPISFWPSRFVPMDLVKTAVIVFGSLASVILLGAMVLGEKKLTLPPKNVSWTGSLIVISLLVSSIISINVEKSLLGQGFELGTAGFIGALFVSALVAFALVYRRMERAVLLYAALGASYFVLYAFHLLRLIFGSDFAAFSILSLPTSSLIGNWYNLGLLSAVALIVSLIATEVLPLSKRMKIFYYVLAALSVLGAYVVNMPVIWNVLALVALGLLVYMTSLRAKTGSGFGHFVKRVSWMPLVAFVIFGSFSIWTESLVAPVAEKMYGNYTELSLPWQMTLDVTVGAIKNYPLFGVGPNHFIQAFIAYKPMLINATNAWNVEFTNGFGLIPTLVSAQGTVGGVLWLLFLVFIGISGAQVLRNIPADPTRRFLLLSSFAVAVFLWISLIVYVPSHAVSMMAFVFLGIFFGVAAASDVLRPYSLAPLPGTKLAKAFPVALSVFIVIAGVWGLSYAKKVIALSYFGSGISELTSGKDPVLADSYFKKAQALDSSDVYWQARAEAALLRATKVSSTLTASSPASTSQAIVAEVVKATNEALGFSRKAIAYDPTNYYNYVSEARVSETAANYKMDNGFENAVAAYGKAIGLNPFNPSLYLSLAKLQAKENKLDDALRSVGAALQVKNNYLDAIFLLSQVHAAKGNLAEAITAARVATQINPQNPMLFFQLGLLEYNNKGYEAAVQAFGQAVKLQPDYANAQYFLGLSDARVGNTDGAIAQFEALAKTNPENQEVVLILANLKAGKPIFADARPPITPTPEKRSSLPIKEKQR